VGRGGCTGQLLGSGNSLRRHNTDQGGGEGGVVVLRREEGEGVRMNRSTEEETGVRVRLTRGRGGGGVSSQILWCGSARAAPMGSRGRREAAKQL
jgi:hypothetical protein